jgi:heme/copper-type cytochrome/quinol oxidase subunit 2
MDLICIIGTLAVILVLGFIFVIIFEAYRRRNNHQYVPNFTHPSILIYRHKKKFLCVYMDCVIVSLMF